MRILAAACALMLGSPIAAAQTYPTRPVTIVTPFSAGSGADIVARQVAEGLSAELGQRFIVDNRTGAGGNIGTQAGARAKPDGYTLLLGTTGPLTVNPTLYGSVGYDPLKDFSPISLVANGPLLAVVTAKSPVKNLPDLIALARSKPGALNYGTTGIGSAPHLAAALLSNAAGIQMVHVPYRGNSEAITDVMAGNLDLAFSGVPSTVSLASAGLIRIVTVTSAHRLAALPDVRTVAEDGFPGAETLVWYGLLAPAGTPAPVIKQLNAALERVVKLPAVRTAFGTLGLEPSTTSPEEFRTLIEKDSERWGGIVRSIGMKPE